MRILLVAFIVFACMPVAARDGGPILLKAGKSPPQGWSELAVQTEYGSGGRVKVGNSDTCTITYSPCYFALANGSNQILVDEMLDYGDSTATLEVSEQRIYVIDSTNNLGRGLARGFAGVLGALATQPDDSTVARTASKQTEVGPLTNVRNGSRFDSTLKSASEPGNAEGFVRPPDVPPPTYPR